MVAIDLSGLNQLTALFNALLQAFLPIILIGAFIAFVILLAGGGKFLGKLTNVFPGSNQAIAKIHRKTRKRNALRIALVSFMFLSILMFSAIPAIGAGEGGAISVGTTQIFANTPLTVTASSLDASQAYAIVYDGTAKFNWTTAATPVDMVITFEATAPSTGSAVTLVLTNSTALAVATLQLFVATAGDFLPTSFLIELGISLIIIGVVALVVISITAGVVKRKVSG